MKEKWSGKYGFILASIGSAVGIGNVWRFPYIMSKNGGGSFLMVYLFCIFTFGIPLMLLEIASGRALSGSIIKVFEKIFRRNKWISFIPIITVFFILCYYIVITGWVLFYFLNSISGNYTDFITFSSGSSSIIFTLITALIVIITVSWGVKDGIERVSKIGIPILFFLVLIMVIKTLTFPNALGEIRNYLKPEIKEIFHWNTWFMAIAQIMFSLSLGTGIMLTYGSYLDKKENIFTSSVIITLSDTLVCLGSAIIIFSFLHLFNLPQKEGMELSFVVLPKLFQSIKYGNFYGVSFFLLLFIAALTSAVSMMETVVRNIIDKSGLSRVTSVLLITPIFLIISSIVSLSYTDFLNINLIEILDNIFGNFMTPVSALLLCIGVSWHWKLEDLVKEMGIEEGLILDRIGESGVLMEKFITYRIVLNLVKYFLPVILTIILIMKFSGIA